MARRGYARQRGRMEGGGRAAEATADQAGDVRRRHSIHRRNPEEATERYGNSRLHTLPSESSQEHGSQGRLRLSRRSPCMSGGQGASQSAFLKKDRTYQYVARQYDCQRCPVKAECLPPGQMRRYVALSIHHSLHLEAKERNEGKRSRRRCSGDRR